MSKSSTIDELIRSEPVINDKKYITDSVNEIHSKINDIRVQLFNISPYVNKKDRVRLEKDSMISKKQQKLIQRQKKVAKRTK